MNTLSSYSPIQQLTLTRYGRLKMLHRDVLPQLDPTDYRVKLTLKALYSTYEDLRELGLDNEGLGEVLAVVGLYNQMNKLADAYQVDPDILPTT